MAQPLHPVWGLGADELEDALEGLVRVSVHQILKGEAPLLSRSRAKYVREPRGQERWQTAHETNARGGGDCEDMASYLCASLRVKGWPARVRVMYVRPGLRHALVEVKNPRTGRRFFMDPSKARGM